MTALKSFTPEGFQFAWDATSVSAFEKCPRYYYYKHIEGWRSHGTNANLLFGGVYASALEHYAKHIAEGVDPEAALSLVVHEALISTWNHELTPSSERIPDTGAPWESEHSTKTRETLIRSIVWYFDHFAPDPAEVVILSDGRPAVEYSFSIPLTSEFMYCGHIDKLVHYSGGTYVMDQKTTGSAITGYFFDQFCPDVQMGGYTWAGKIIFNLPVSGVIIDAAQIMVGFTRFARGFVHYPEALLNEWHENTLSTIHEAKAAHLSGHYPMRRSSCGNYGGCEFRRVCSRHPQHRANILASDYVRAPRWDPLTRR